MQRSGYGNAWEIAVPNGTYSVRVVAGDAAAYDSTYAIAAEGVTVVAGKPTSTVKWFDGTQTVAVADGRLTLTNAAGSANNKVCFVDLHQLDAPGDLPLVSVTASDPSAAETATGASADGGSFVVSRTGDTTQPLTVNYTIGGSATAGTDYVAPAGSVTIPAGAGVGDGERRRARRRGGGRDRDCCPGAGGVGAVRPGRAGRRDGERRRQRRPAAADVRAHVNFQPAGSPVPTGYVADAGAVFADRGNGLAYGWDLSTASLARDRNSAASADQRYDTLTSMQRSGSGSVWELAVPNGTYTVHLVAGDAGGYDSTYAIAAEGVTVVAGKPMSSVRWFEGTKTVTVSDGRLTLTNAAGSANNKVCFVDVVGQATGPALPVVTVSASDASASEAAGNPGGFTVARTGPTDEPLVVSLSVGGGRPAAPTTPPSARR